MPSRFLFRRIAVIGIGLIGASFALALREKGLAEKIICGDASDKHVQMALELEIVDEGTTDCAAAVRDADLVVLAVPVGAMGSVAAAIAPFLASGAIVMDVGSVKQAVIAAVAPHIPKGVFFIPAHPIAGTEDSGPEAGFAELFQNRWCLLTPDDRVDPAALARVQSAWEACGARVACMTAAHHDRILATTSHVPHVLAFSLMGTADSLARDLQAEVISYSAGTFRDMTRVAASDPVMWRDIFLNNREAVLEILDRFRGQTETLAAAIRAGDGAAIQQIVSHVRTLRRSLAPQAPVEPLPLKEEKR